MTKKRGYFAVLDPSKDDKPDQAFLRSNKGGCLRLMILFRDARNFECDKLAKRIPHDKNAYCWEKKTRCVAAYKMANMEPLGDNKISSAFFTFYPPQHMPTGAI